jgi:hypothetical protein
MGPPLDVAHPLTAPARTAGIAPMLGVPLVVTVSAASLSLLTGNATTFTAAPVGGVRPDSASRSFSDGSTGSGRHPVGSSPGGSAPESGTPLSPVAPSDIFDGIFFLR